MRVVLLVSTSDMLLTVQKLDDLEQVEACQLICSDSLPCLGHWIKSCGLTVGDGWQVSSLPPMLQDI